MTLVEYLQTKGLSVVAKSGDNYLMSPCPHCGKESTTNNRHFFANNEVGHCFSCGQKGNFYQYIQLFGDDPTEYLGERKSERREFRNSAGELVAVWSREYRKKPVKPLEGLAADFLERSQRFLWSPDFKPAAVAREYLMQTRRFPEEALRSFQIGLVPRGSCADGCGWHGVLPREKTCPKCGGKTTHPKWWISIPYLTNNGKVSLVKYRSIPPAEKAFEREAGGTTELFGAWRLNGTEKRLVVVESELDAVAVLSMGLPAVAIAGAQNWRDDWLEYFEPIEDIILAGDADDPGVEAMRKLSEKLGAFRCRMLEWPDNVKDAAEYLEQGGTAAGFQALVDAAKPLRGRVWLSGSDFTEIVDRLRSRGPGAYGMKTGWHGVDSLLGGVRPGEVTVVTAETGSGKSMFSTEWALRMSAAGMPAALASFEMTADAMVMRILTQVAGSPFYSIMPDPLQSQAVIEQVAQRPFYLLDLRGSITMQDLRAILRWGVVRYGVRFIVLDHLHYFMQVDDPRNERQVIDNWVRTLCQWAEEWAAHIVLVVHPSKRGGDRRTSGRIEIGDLKGSSGISQEAHNVVALYRARGYERAQEEETGQPVALGATELVVLKARSQLAREGTAWFWFSRDSLTYADMPPIDAQLVRDTEARASSRRPANAKRRASDTPSTTTTSASQSGVSSDATIGTAKPAEPVQEDDDESNPQKFGWAYTATLVPDSSPSAPRTETENHAPECPASRAPP